MELETLNLVGRLTVAVCGPGERFLNFRDDTEYTVDVVNEYCKLTSSASAGLRLERNHCIEKGNLLIDTSQASCTEVEASSVH